MDDARSTDASLNPQDPAGTARAAVLAARVQEMPHFRAALGLQRCRARLAAGAALGWMDSAGYVTSVGRRHDQRYRGRRAAAIARFVLPRADIVCRGGSRSGVLQGLTAMLGGRMPQNSSVSSNYPC